MTIGYAAGEAVVVDMNGDCFSLSGFLGEAT